GIDVIFGTHSHRKDELLQIPGTTTWFISPFQYLTYVSRIVMTFEGHRLTQVSGGLVPVDVSIPEDREVAARVATLQHELASDPKYAELFRPIGVLDPAMDVLAVGTKTVQIMRQVSDADVAISTVSSFRQAIPSGPLTMEELRAALPYDNEIVVAELSGASLQKVLDLARDGVDGGAYIDGLPKVDPARLYRVATTDYMARIAAGYRDAFAGAKIESTGKRVRNELRKALASSH
ncbi:MAG: 5'-nucleotidase C-terminal domain-containing protein, partial [Thermoanaerobaculia bacterium]